MKRNSKTLILLLLCTPVFFFTSCKKDDVKKEDLATIKKNWLIGTWKQTDVTLAYPIPNPFGGDDLPVGTSLHLLSGYLPITGPMIEATNDNVFTFDQKGSYSITGSIDWMLPHSATTGTWNTQAHGSALHLLSGDSDVPLWIENIDADHLKLGSVSNTIYVAEVDADIPVYFLFEKQ